jgi:ankyrin repeat protein
LGRTNLVEVILRFCATQKLNVDTSTNDAKKIRLLNLISKYSVNSLLLAARNGHNDIIRLLLAYNVCDLNGQDPTNGCTALHEASRYGRYQTVKLLLECGADLTRKNFYGKRALDVVIKNNKIGSDIKCLINEFSQAIHVVSIKPHFNSHTGSLNFEQNELITVLESPKLTSACSSSSIVLNTEFTTNVAALNWRGFILNKTNFTTRFGYFPSSYVSLIEQRGPSINENINETTSIINNIKRPSFLTSSTTSLALSQHDPKQLTTLNSDINVDNISLIERVISDQASSTSSSSVQNSNEIIYSNNIKCKNKNENIKQDNQVNINFYF